MGRKKTYEPLNVLINNRVVGRLERTSGGAIEFVYDRDWLGWEHTQPVSLALPLREQRYSGAPVAAVFENLLPDSNDLRRQVADRVGAQGADAYSLLTAIGRDCVGAMQLLPDGLMEAANAQPGKISGEEVGEAQIADILRNLHRAPLGLEADDAFRISVAGAQEKTALLCYEDKWLKPLGTTPTTHILKPQIGRLPNGVDLTYSVENEFYCLKLCEAFGLPVNSAEIVRFEDKITLVIERFDRQWTRDGRLLRRPQEDCCQALGVTPTIKYQDRGGPGMQAVMDLLRGSDDPAHDRAMFFKAQILFWLIGATDGHAKNFSIFLGPGGRYRMTPLYDVLTTQPSLDAGQVRQNQMKMAMSVGNTNHYRINTITRRHFLESARQARLSTKVANSLIDELVERAEYALETVAETLPKGFPGEIHESVSAAVRARLRMLKRADGE